MTRHERAYFIPKTAVVRVHPCVDVVPLASGLALAALEGLPALVMEPECMRSGATSADAIMGEPPLAVIVAQRGSVWVAIAADAVAFVPAVESSSSLLLSCDQIQAAMAASS